MTQAALIILSDQMRGNKVTHPLSLAPSAVRALYALQLELGMSLIFYLEL